MQDQELIRRYFNLMVQLLVYKTENVLDHDSRAAQVRDACNKMIQERGHLRQMSHDEVYEVLDNLKLGQPNNSQWWHCPAKYADSEMASGTYNTTKNLNIELNDLCSTFQTTGLTTSLSRRVIELENENRTMRQIINHLTKDDE